MKTLYVIPSFKCNLNCPHCEIHKKQDDFNEELFFNKLEQTDCEQVILFGGEPLFNKNRFKKCLETNKFTSISSNLLLMNDENLNLIKKYNLSIATSWNPQRFNDLEFSIWQGQLKALAKNDMHCIILITLTEDLLSYDMDKLLQMFEYWDNIKSVDGILFEHLVDYNMKKDLHQRADEWLCKLYDKWTFKFENIIVNRLNNWNCDCHNVYTLFPNGKLLNICPQYEMTHIVNDCYTCSLVNKCRPCKLQHLCSFPKQLYKKVNNE